MNKLIKVSSAQQPGNYKPTALDTSKNVAAIKLLQVCPKIVESSIDLRGRGIKKLTVENRYQVSDSAWSKLQAKYITAVDF